MSCKLALRRSTDSAERLDTRTGLLAPPTLALTSGEVEGHLIYPSRRRSQAKRPGVGRSLRKTVDLVPVLLPPRNPAAMADLYSPNFEIRRTPSRSFLTAGREPARAPSPNPPRTSASFRSSYSAPSFDRPTTPKPPPYRPPNLRSSFALPVARSPPPGYQSPLGTSRKGFQGATGGRGSNGS